MNYQGDFTTANTIYVYFNTFDSNDPSASVTLTGLAVTDIEIYKDGSVTQRSSDAGYVLLDTDGIDFDTTTGVHGFSVDLSDNTDVGFFAAGSEYAVVVASVTVDGATINFVAATFSIERSGGALALLKGTNSLANIEDKIDIIDTNVDDIEATVITNATGVDIAADIIALKAETVLILADTGELQVDDTPTALAAIQTVVDKIPLSDGVISWNATALAAIESEVNDAMVVLQLDHLLHVADATTTTNNSIIAKMVSKSATAAFSSFVNTTDSLEAIKDNTAWDTATGFSTHAATDIVTSGAITTAAGAVVTVTTAGTTTTNTDLATLTTGMTSLTEWLGAMSGDQASDATAQTEMRATGAGSGTYLATSDSLEATRTHIGDGTNLAEAGGDGDHLTAINLPNQTMDITGNITGNLSGSIGSNTELGPTEVASELATYDGPTNTEMEARTPTAAELAYIVANAATGVPVTFTTSGGTTTAAVLNQVDGAGASTTDDQYNGRLLVFNLGTLKEVVTDITDYDGGTVTATITAIPFAPTASHTARLI